MSTPSSQGMREFADAIKVLQANAYVQTDIVAVDLSEAFTDRVVNLPNPCTLLALPPMILDRNGNFLTNDVADHVWIRFNSQSAPGIKFNSAGTAGTANLFAGPMYRLFLTNPSAGGGKLYFLVATGISLGSGSGGPSGGNFSNAQIG